MYIPKFFASEDEALAREIAAGYAFGMLMTLPAGAAADADISHLPMLWTGERLIGHVARANPHGARFDGGSPSVAVFSGPHAYISPNWYAHDGLVPTWNYAAVHLHGRPDAVEDEAHATDILDTLVAAFESDATGNWSTGKLPDGMLSRQLKGIVAFEMPVERIEIKVKMSQNRKPDDIDGVINALDASQYENDRATAAMMRGLNVR
ncbi:MAG: FMN-binding negative transcriptional regulator [Rhodospirillales bacterium]|nr:FMN-binding negative transcriptional regulator [Rhodospirillales bacterium]MBO6788126.1 FMN-binding negative transcriptional regulator [Rhodospirillales bacterium]